MLKPEHQIWRTDAVMNMEQSGLFYWFFFSLKFKLIENVLYENKAC